MRRLVEHHLMLWTGLQALLLCGAVLLLGASPLIASALVAIALPVSWIFLRWSAVNAGWAYPGTLLVVVVLWLPWMEVGVEQVLVAVGLVILVANAFLSGPTRWFGLPLATAAGLSFLWFWIPRLDRYVLAVFDDRSIWEEGLAVGFRAPMAFLILLVLLLEREEKRMLVPVFDQRNRILMHCVALVVALAWSLGYRPDPLLGLLLGAVAAFGIKQSFRSMPLLDLRCLRWPALDGLAMMLASVLVAVGGAYATWQERAQAGKALAGALGPYLLAAEHDVLAILFAFGVLVVLHRWLDWYMLIDRRLHRPGGLGSLG